MILPLDGPARGPVTRRFARASALALAAALAGGCTGTRVQLPFDSQAGDAMAEAYELRYKRPAGTADRYKGKYDVRIRQKETGERARGAGSQRLLRDEFQSDEKATAEFTCYHTGKTAMDKFDRVVIHRRNVKRELLEVAPNGTVKHTKRLGVPYQPLVTPNFQADPAMRELYYVAMDDLGRIARRKETPYHYAANDSLCYMFPIFAKEKVRVRQRWTFLVPVIVGLDYSDNVMDLTCTATFSDLRRVRSGGEGDGSLRAVIEYTYYGILDTRHPADAGRLPPGAPNVVWRRFTVEGEGKAYLDIQAGKIVWKREDYRVLIERTYDRLVKRPDRDEARKKKDAPPEIERMHYVAMSAVSFSSRLLGPGERADERPARREQ